MKVFNLQCDLGHGFEGWFGSESDFHDQVERALLECPLCASKTVRRLPSAPRLNLAHPRAEGDVGAAGPAPAPAEPVAHTPQHQAVQALWARAVQHVLANTDDVGPQFAEEARRIHYGEAEERGIRGQTTAEELRELREDGIEVLSLPVPAAFKGPLQ